MTWIRAMSLIAVFAALAAPGSALARTDVSYSPSSGLLITATTRASLDLLVRDDEGVLEWQLNQNGQAGVDVNLVAGVGCRQAGAVDVFCHPTDSRAINATLSDDNSTAGETFKLDEVQLGLQIPTFTSSVTIDGRGGRDDLQGSRGPDTLRGGDGNDLLQPDRGNDVAEGGAGDDSLFATNFQTILLAESIGPNGADVYRGGPGSDTLAYNGRREPIVVSLDGQANDGAPGENDNAGPDNDIENVVGGGSENTLVGNDGANRLEGKGDDDTISGAGGDDILRGGFSGDDDLSGGPGADVLLGDTGNDRLSSFDGTRDVTVDCGAGLGDRAVVDLFDTAKQVKNCEQVLRFAIDDAPPGTPLGRRLRIRKDGVVSVGIACPRRAKVRCHGRLSLRDPKRRGRVLASGSYTARLGRKARVALRLTKKERALLRRRGRVLVTTRERGISRRGPRGAERLLRLARS